MPINTKALHRLIKSGDLYAVAELLYLHNAAGISEVNDYDSAGHTPLMAAVTSANPSVSIVRALIENGANIHMVSKHPVEEDKSALALAVCTGKAPIVNELIESGANIQYRRTGNYDALLDAVHGRDVLRDDGLIDLLQLLIANRVELDTVTSYSESGTRVLSHIGRFDAVKCLLDAGADASILSMSPLIAAVAFGTIADVRHELERDGLLEARDWWERTAWLVAVQTGEIDKAKLLKEAGADTGATGRCGVPALFYAIQNYHTPMLQWLIDIGIAESSVSSMSSMDDFGTTCLMTAAESNNLEAIDDLLQAGIDVNERTSQKLEFGGLPEFANLLQGIDKAFLDKAVSTKTALQSAVSPAAARRLMEAGADPADLQFEARRAILGLPPDADADLLNVSPAEYRAWRSPRLGNSNPELISSPFCEGMIRAGIIAYHARERYEDKEYKYGSPVWCAQRFGQSLTFLPNGRIVQIGGEHEDSYDPDFCIYNDVFAHYPDGTIQIYNYPTSAFPPTDFHTATLVGDSIFIIGALGYPGSRRYGVTPVYRLDTTSFVISEIKPGGTAPGWLFKHRAVLQSPHQIKVFGGTIATKTGGKETHAANERTFILDTNRLEWSIELSGPSAR